ncbi:hypothetical protein G9A89_001127 [Geosiphon pyriformis]|nr:hypothetical protein G9A89_001127 [Geosiphon pyriformis]
MRTNNGTTIHTSQMQRLWKKTFFHESLGCVRQKLLNVNPLLLQVMPQKMDNKPCLACGEQLLNEGMWNNIPTISHLDSYLHDKDEIWQIVNAKIEGITSNKIREIKNNPPEPVKIVLVPNPNAFLDLKTGPEEFHKHYQNLALTKEKQEQHLKQLNT